ncbi:MAG: 50S ribosomal protein L5 [bacterium]|nr:50S ribosomal protein L5 [bacterium]
MNLMKNIRIEKVTLNIGAGKDAAKLEKGIRLIKNITGITPVKTFTNKRIPGWGLRPGLPIGCRITLRKKAARELLSRLLQAKDNVLQEGQFDNEGNIAFGIPEYIDIPGVSYDPDIGIMGLQVCVTLERPGFRLKKRHVKKKSLPGCHRIRKNETIEFVKNEFKVKLGEE